MKSLNRVFLFCKTYGFILLAFSSCVSVQKSEIIEDAYYSVSKKIEIKENPQDSTLVLHKKKKIYIEDHTDSLLIYPSKERNTLPVPYKSNLNNPLHLHQKSLDIDLFVVPVKVRLPQKYFPAQLNTQFNACMYLGYRIDYYKISSSNRYATSPRRKILRNGFGIGGFAGLATVVMNPWVTNNAISYEYDGLAISYGFSTIYAVQKFNAGIAVGFDYLTDRNQDVWIYHHKPWIGILIGLNLN